MTRNGARYTAAVMGAGPMGLAAAYELAKRGVAVTLFERDDRIGGMSAHPAGRRTNTRPLRRWRRKEGEK